MGRRPGGGEETFIGLLDTESHCTAIPKPVGEVLTVANLRSRRYGDATVDEIKMNVRMKTGFFEQILSEVVASPLPESIIGMDIMSDGGMLLSPSLVKQKACKSALRLVSIGHPKWEPQELP